MIGSTPQQGNQGLINNLLGGSSALSVIPGSGIKSNGAMTQYGGQQNTGYYQDMAQQAAGFEPSATNASSYAPASSYSSPSAAGKGSNPDASSVEELLSSLGANKGVSPQVSAAAAGLPSSSSSGSSSGSTSTTPRAVQGGLMRLLSSL